MGFTPLASSAPTKGFTPGFTPLPDNQEDEQPSAFAPAIETVKDIGRVYPVLETAGNLATQAIAMPVAGLAGLGAVATKALGITDTEPADVVHGVAGAMTYQPQTESGQHLTNAAIYPFEKLQQAGQYVGGKTLEATGSPTLATVADTAVNALPMALPMKASEPKGILARAADKHAEFKAAQEVQQVAPEVTAAEIPMVSVETAAETIARAPDHPAVPIETMLARNAQEAITQPDAGLPLAVTEKAPGMPLSQAIDSLPLERAIAEAPKVATPAPRAGFIPIGEIRAMEMPEELSAADQAAVPQKMGEVFNQSALLSENDIPKTLKIANPETGKGQFNAQKVMRIANENVSKLESLKSAGYDGASILNAATLKEITKATNQRMIRGMSQVDARTYAVQTMLDEAMAERQMVSDLISKELGLPDMRKADAMVKAEAARFDQPVHSNIPDAGVTKPPPAEVEVFSAKEAMDAVGVTGVDRTNTIAALRRGELTADDVIEAHQIARQPEIAPENAMAGSVGDAPLQQPKPLEDIGASVTNGEKQNVPTASVHEAPASPMKPSEAIRLNVEQLDGMRKAAGKFKLAAQLNFAIQKAKVAMKSGTGEAEYFTRAADQFKGKDDQIHAALTGIADALEPVKPADAMPKVNPETRATGKG